MFRTHAEHNYVNINQRNCKEGTTQKFILANHSRIFSNLKIIMINNCVL